MDDEASACVCSREAGESDHVIVLEVRITAAAAVAGANMVASFG